MQRRNAPRLRRIRLVMLLSIVLLAGFLGYWLRREYQHERGQLAEELNAMLVTVSTRLDDSLLLRNYVRPLQESIAAQSPGEDSGRLRKITYRIDSPAASPVRIDMRLRRNTDPGAARDTVIIAHHSRTIGNGSFEFRSDSISSDSYHAMRTAIVRSGPPGQSAPGLEVYEEDGTTLQLGDSSDRRITRGIRMLIRTLSELPGSVNKEINPADPALVRDQFHASLRKIGISGTLHWEPDSGNSVGTGLQLTGDLLHDRKAVITGYEPNLIRRISPQFGFSVLLLCITGLAFAMTFRALRSQMQLAAIRNDFISNMSHELKTPVSTVKVALEAISEPEVLANRPLAEEYLGMAGLELNRLELLIHQALQSALLEGGRVRMDTAPLELGETAAQMGRVMQPRFQQCGGALLVNGAAPGYRVAGDQLHLQGVFVNILDNALKYAGPAPRVEMSLEGSDASAVIVTIRDYGPGIPEPYRSKVFEKFFRVPRGNEHSVKGYGLGLNYAAEVLRAHGGSITLTEAPGGGCCFRISIPRLRP